MGCSGGQISMYLPPEHPIIDIGNNRIQNGRRIGKKVYMARTSLNLSKLMKNKVKTHYHDGSLLILNTTFFSFLSTLKGCCDAQKFKKKSTFSIFNNLYAVLKLSRLLTNVYGSAKKHTFYSSSPLPSYHRSSEQSIVPNLPSVEQKRSPYILPEIRAFKNASPHISPTIRAEILLQSPHKVPVFPHISPGYTPLLLGEADDKYIRADSRITPIRALPTVFLYKQSACNGRVSPAYETSIHQGVV